MGNIFFLFFSFFLNNFSFLQNVIIRYTENNQHIVESTCLNFHLPLIFDLVISIFERVTLIFNNINIHFICRQFYRGSSNMSFEGTQFLQKYSLDK